MNLTPTIERIPGTAKTWRKVGAQQVTVRYQGEAYTVTVEHGFAFEFSWLWPLRFLAHPNKMHNAAFAYWHDVALELFKTADGQPFDRRWCARFAAHRSRDHYPWWRRWKLWRNRLAARLFTHDLAAARRFFLGRGAA
jgi:hypothetical protein